MKAGKYAFLAPAILFVYLFVSGLKIVNPLPLTYDAALHSEIAAYVVPNELIPSTWEPLADIGYTYPPLFHWIAFLFSFTGVETYKIVVLMGLFLYSMFPVAFYIYGSVFGRREAVLFSFFGAVQASLTEVFAAGEYPQLLSMALMPIVFYFVEKRDYLKSGMISGLVFLAHSFSGIYLVSMIFICFLFNFKEKKRIRAGQMAVFFAAVLVASSVWTPKYLQIINNAADQKWENTIWYYKAGFAGLDRINDIFFSFMPGARMGLTFLLLSMIGVAHARKTKLNLQLLVFLFTVIFTIFHIPGTQYKFHDMLAVATPPIAAFGAIRLSVETKKMNQTARGILACVIAALLILNPYVNATNLRNCCVSKDTPDAAQFKLAEWLKNNDSRPGLVIADGDYEIWFALVSGKYPVNPRISELEVFTNEYRQRLEDRKILAGLVAEGLDPSAVASKLGVHYLVTEKSVNSANFIVIREENGTKLYKYYP
ncbi:MAG: hypothetical protein HY051_00890 [Candidatus Aenigmarchaeota archaeon]|nr:hypothetical protein [Candidatus Aenigmarchaeota archaeon]